MSLFRPLHIVALFAGALTAGAAETDLQARLDAAAPGAVVELDAGVHEGPVRVTKPLTLKGKGSAIIDGRRIGSVIEVRADNVRLEGLVIRNSGLELQRDEAGIHSTGDNTTVINNRLESCLHGIYFREVEGGEITGNTIIGATGGEREPAFDVLSRNAPGADSAEMCAVGRLSENRRGNGIHLWSSSDVKITENRVARTRDGIYFSFADDCRIRNNTVRETRYGLHYMYSDNNDFDRNTFTENAAGAALMYSGDIRATENDFSGNRGRRAYGMLLQSVDDSNFDNNRFEGNTIGAYAENSQRNTLRDNRLQGNYIALRLGGSSANNRFLENTFAHNLHTVEASGDPNTNTWADDGRGNRWQGSSASPDLDGDGVGAIPHREADFLGKLRNSFPLVGFLSGSPGLNAMRFAHERARVPGVPTINDPHPLVGKRKSRQ